MAVAGDPTGRVRLYWPTFGEGRVDAVTVVVPIVTRDEFNREMDDRDRAGFLILVLGDLI